MSLNREVGGERGGRRGGGRGGGHAGGNEGGHGGGHGGGQEGGYGGGRGRERGGGHEGGHGGGHRRERGGGHAGGNEGGQEGGYRGGGGHAGGNEGGQEGGYRGGGGGRERGGGHAGGNEGGNEGGHGGGRRRERGGGHAGGNEGGYGGGRRRERGGGHAGGNEGGHGGGQEGGYGGGGGRGHAGGHGGGHGGGYGGGRGRGRGGGHAGGNEGGHGERQEGGEEGGQEGGYGGGRGGGRGRGRGGGRGGGHAGGNEGRHGGRQEGEQEGGQEGGYGGGRGGGRGRGRGGGHGGGQEGGNIENDNSTVRDNIMVPDLEKNKSNLSISSNVSSKTTETSNGSPTRPISDTASVASNTSLSEKRWSRGWEKEKEYNEEVVRNDRKNVHSSNLSISSDISSKTTEKSIVSPSQSKSATSTAASNTSLLEKRWSRGWEKEKEHRGGVVRNDRKNVHSSNLSISSNVSSKTTGTTSAISYTSLVSNDLNKFKFCSRPDKGGEDGRETLFKTNFYTINIDYSNGFYHYDVEISFPYERTDGIKTEAAAKKEYKTEIVEKVFYENKFGSYVYDGEKNIYTINKIDLTKPPIDGLKTNIKLHDEEEEKTFVVKLKLASSIDFKTMKDYIEGKVFEIPKPAINLINLVIRQNKLKTHVLEKNSLFNLNGKKYYMKNRLYYVIGQYLSIKPCSVGWLQNCDMDSAIFHNDITLVELLLELFPSIRLRHDFKLNENQKSIFQKEIKGLSVSTTHIKNNKKKYKILGLSSSANDEKFELNDFKTNEKRTVSVAEYFNETYRSLKIQYPNLPCVKVGNPTKPIFFPLEVCKLTSGQRYRKTLNLEQQKIIATETVKSPIERAKCIDHLMKQNVQNKDILDQFGIDCKKDEMLQVKARILKSPNVLYRDGKTPIIRNATWNMANNLNLYDTRNLERWFLIWIAKDKKGNKLKHDDVELNKEKLIEGILQIFKNGGLNTSRPTYEYLPDTSIPEIFKSLFENNKPQLIMFVMNKTEERDQIKRLAEKEYGLMTQCIKFDKLITQIDQELAVDDIHKEKKLLMYLSNVLLKVNAKIGGINNLADLPLLNKEKLNRQGELVMFFGADVTHQASENLSIAAVVGSLNSSFTHYGVQLSEQYHEKEGRKSKEIINDLQQMAFLLIKSFQGRNKILPTKIIFYRDGVDEGQFQNVLNHELTAIKKACNQIQAGYSPAITIIIVQKRHHIRFFPVHEIDKMGKSGNIPAGSVIDTGVTTLNFFDFFLCSHEAIQGTAQPIHYWVIYDEIGFSSDEIQNLTFMMCHLYVKTTKAVSIPAPVYYAHLAAFRGRIYKQSDNHAERTTDINNARSFENLNQSGLIDIHSELNDTMFFT